VLVFQDHEKRNNENNEWSDTFIVVGLDKYLTFVRIYECVPISNQNPPGPIRRMIWQEREIRWMNTVLWSNIIFFFIIIFYLLNFFFFFLWKIHLGTLSNGQSFIWYIVNLMKLIFIPKKDSHPDTIGADIALSVTLRSLAGGR